MRTGWGDMRVMGWRVARTIVIGCAGLVAAGGISQLQAQRTVVATHADSDVTTGNIFARQVTLTLHNASLKSAIKALAMSSGVRIQYRTEHVDAQARQVDLDARQLPLGVVLQDILSGTGLAPSVISSDLIVLTKLAVTNETGTITGTVIDSATKAPLRDVLILVNDTSTRVVTNADGSFRLTGIPVGSQKIGVRLMGYTKASRVVAIESGKTMVMDFVIQRSTHALDQVVVTGTVAETEMKVIPNAITVITAKDLEDRGVTHIDQLFRGAVPGLFAMNKGTAFKGQTSFKRETVTMFSRGATMLDSVSPPIKTYIDGIEMSDPDYINQIDPSSIERIEIVAGAQASAIYGSGALGGVMQIFTKKGTLGAQRPELNISLKYGALENNFSTSRAPRHDYGISVTDAIGPYSYNLGGGYTYEGQWTPGRYAEGWSGYGGMQRSTGLFTSTLSGRWSQRQHGAGGGAAQGVMGAYEQGLIIGTESFLIPEFSSIYDVDMYNLGLSSVVRVTRNWSHSITLGVDRTLSGSETRGARYTTVSDSMEVGYRNGETIAKTLSYTTTVSQMISSWGSVNLTAGTNLAKRTGFNRDGRVRDLDDIRTAQYGWINEGKVSTHTSGYFGQLRLGVLEQVFLTLGLRAELSPSYGSKNKVHYTPSNGLTFTRDFGLLTAKARMSYGSATRAPILSAKDSILECVRAPSNCESQTKVYWSESLLHQLPNPDLRPESQTGPEGGIDLYWSNLGSLSVTHYRQEVKDLISRPQVNTVVSTVPQYGRFPEYHQYQYQNLGDISNQGWTMDASLNISAFTLNGSYTWMKSRVTRLNPLYAGEMYLGGSAPGMAEHFGSFNVSYSYAQTTVSVFTNWIGQILQARDVNGGIFYDRPRDFIEQQALNASFMQKDFVLPSKTEMTINAQRRLNSSTRLFLNITNATNRYDNEGSAGQNQYPVLGRQTTLGLQFNIR